MLYLLCLRLLNGHTINTNSQLYFGGLGTLGLLDLLTELQFSDTLLDHIYTLGLLHLC